jgi:hypothetical protein
VGERDTLTTLLILSLIGIPLVLVVAVFYSDILSLHLGQAALGGLVLLAIGAIIKGISSTYSTAMAGLRKEAELIILEELSHGISLPRKVLVGRVRKANWVFYLFGGTAVLALRTLHSGGLVVIANGEYSVAKEYEHKADLSFRKTKNSASKSN